MLGLVEEATADRNGHSLVWQTAMSDEVIEVKLNVPNPDTMPPGAQTILYDPSGTATRLAPTARPTLTRSTI
jgi:hypothetical protein